MICGLRQVAPKWMELDSSWQSTSKFVSCQIHANAKSMQIFKETIHLRLLEYGRWSRTPELMMPVGRTTRSTVIFCLVQIRQAISVGAVPFWMQDAEGKELIGSWKQAFRMKMSAVETRQSCCTWGIQCLQTVCTDKHIGSAAQLSLATDLCFRRPTLIASAFSTTVSFTRRAFRQKTHKCYGLTNWQREFMVYLYIIYLCLFFSFDAVAKRQSWRCRSQSQHMNHILIYESHECLIAFGNVGPELGKTDLQSRLFALHVFTVFTFTVQFCRSRQTWLGRQSFVVLTSLETQKSSWLDQDAIIRENRCRRHHWAV